MSPEEAREHFSEAFEDALDREQRAAFELALAEDPALRADYDDFVDTFQMLGRLSEVDPVPVPNLLPKIQDRLRRRSRGRYYRDRFSEKAGRFTWLVMLLAVITVMMLAGATFLAIESGVDRSLLPPATQGPSSGP